jgi:DNA-binding NarL/FixJ family response regulator
MGLEPITLTSREYDVLTRLGMKTQDIAEDLEITIGTVNKYYYRLSAKLNANTRAEVIIKALKLGLVEAWEFII